MINKEQLFSAAKTILADIETIIHYNSPGEFYLPEDSGGELTYNLFGQDLIVEFDWEELDYDGQNIVLGDYYNNESTIKIVLRNANPVDFNTLSNVGEVIAHELTHWLQEMNGFSFPNLIKIDDDKYYLQPHEVEAQFYGFEFQSAYLNKSLEQVLELWLEKYEQYHNFRNTKKFKQKLLSSFEKFAQEEFHF
jgi:hypothetical protein